MHQDLDLIRADAEHSQRASITSRPLFMRVAESIGDFPRPIRHVGMGESAWSGRDLLDRSAGPSRNGPPDAVRMSRATSPGSLAGEALPDRGVLRIDRPQPP